MVEKEEKTTKSKRDTSSFETIKFLRQSRVPSKKPQPHYPRLAKIANPHVDSFNSIFVAKILNPNNNAAASDGSGLLDLAIAEIGKKYVFDGSSDIPVAERNKLEVWFSNITVSSPSSSKGIGGMITPSECRGRGITYSGVMQGTICWTVNGENPQNTLINLGKLPIMVRSLKCHLSGKSPKELVEYHEDADEFGGYFIVNGNERLLRLLVAPRRNHPIALIRPAFMKRGPTYTNFGVQMRCVRNDQTSQTFTVHYCTDGNIVFRFSFRKQEYMVPIMLILRSLKQVSDKEIFERLTMGRESDTFLTDRIELLLRGARAYGVHSRLDCLSFIGSKFHVMLDSPEDSTEEEAGIEFLNTVVLVNLKSNTEKFDMLMYGISIIGQL
ncbi:hypothetical protein HK096_010250 [Nowakowskiella sp. JEL0078]|nr:hypothetical protein HK096_010250 [Nowakowskiella sp. JEL0078]